MTTTPQRWCAAGPLFLEAQNNPKLPDGFRSDVKSRGEFAATWAFYASRTGDAREWKDLTDEEHATWSLLSQAIAYAGEIGWQASK